eukprot:3913002-Prymnesium_polylepis.2
MPTFLIRISVFESVVDVPYIVRRFPAPRVPRPRASATASLRDTCPERTAGADASRRELRGPFVRGARIASL